MELVKQGLTSKEIARALGISHRTVDQHIAAAIENLGVTNRLAAVTRLHEMEQEERAKSPPPPFMLSYKDRPAVHLFEPAPVEEVKAPVPEAEQSAEGIPILPPIGGSANTYPSRVRLTLIARIAVLSIMLICLAIVSILAVMELANWIDW